MKNIKYIALTLVLTALLTFGYLNFMGTSVSANPDYICVKSVSRTCSIDETKCEEWNTKTWTRTCEGTRVSKVWYYHTRTSCESGYTVEKTWSTSTSWTAAKFADQSALDSNWNSWSSGRHSTDFVYWTENCSIQEIDKTRPGWEVEQVN
jgi:hypothetical protein